jgi:hypothetical protein
VADAIRRIVVRSAIGRLGATLYDSLALQPQLTAKPRDRVLSQIVPKEPVTGPSG